MSKRAAGAAIYIRQTITIPASLTAFLDRQSKLPAHGGNISSYIRSLLVREDRRSRRAQDRERRARLAVA